MPIIDLELSTVVPCTFRVEQVAGMFDLPLTERMVERLHFEIPELPADWRIGLITGPSGSGKSSLARAWFGSEVAEPATWSDNAAVIEGFGTLSTRQITGLLTAVGLGSPPSWLKPYRVLSTCERFRCDLARALARHLTAPPHKLPTTVFDEYSTPVDRTVARCGSAALAKALRNGQIPGRFVAVTCHDDIREWLTPDWTYDVGTRVFDRRLLRRPALQLELVRCDRSVWQNFKRHHYLSGSLSRSARCYALLFKRRPIGFIAVLPLIGRRDHWRITRLVVLPDYQGWGIGTALAAAVARLYRAAGCRINITASHPSMIAHCIRSPHWRLIRVQKTGAPPPRTYKPNYRGSPGRSTASFEYIGCDKSSSPNQ